MRVMAFLILCISLLYSSCFCPSADSIEIPTEFHDYFGVFKPGNYWVYQTNSLKYDSMYVSYYKDSSVSFGAGRCTFGRLKTRSINIKSTYLNSTYSSNLEARVDGGYFEYELRLGTDIFRLVYIDKIIGYPKELKDTLLSENRSLYLKKNVGIVAYKIGNDSFYLVRKKIM